MRSSNPCSWPFGRAARTPVAACAVLAFAGVLSGASASPLQTTAGQVTQTPIAQPPATPHATHIRKRPSAAHPAAAPDPIAVQPVTPPEPEKPKWPAFDPASAPTVVWDSQGLSINATNASLQQILKDVATETGAKIDGMTTDQRVFGVYGPGQAKDVLSQLLQGSGYNVIMIGDQGQGTPRQVLLSARQSGAATPPVAHPAPANGDDDSEAEEPAESPEPVRPQFAPGGPPRNPQQFMQDMQRRQEQQGQQPQGQQTPTQPTTPATPPN